MGALTDLWKSERGLVAIALIAACTVLTFTGRLTVEQWTSYTTWIFGLYAAAKTVTGTVGIIKSTPTQGTGDLSSFLSLLSTLGRPPAPGTTTGPSVVKDVPPSATGPDYIDLELSRLRSVAKGAPDPAPPPTPPPASEPTS